MNEDEVRERAFAMPLTSPAFPMGPYRFVDREYLIITYRTDPAKLRALVPEPLEIAEPLVKFEFIRMPDSTGFGDYTESGQVIPVTFQGRQGGYTHCMFLDDHPPIAGGRELWGFPKKLAKPTLQAEIDTLVGTLDYGPVRIATGTMGYKHKRCRPRRGRGLAGDAELAAQDHPACRRHRAHLRAGRVLSRGRHAQGCLDRPGGARASPRTPWRRWPSCRCWRWSAATHILADLTLGPRQGRPRLSELNCERSTRHAPEGQDRPGHRRRQRHRQGDRHRLRPGRGEGGDRRPQPGGRRRHRRRAEGRRRRGHGRRHGRHRRGPGRRRLRQGGGGLGRRRRAGQQRRHPDRRAGRGVRLRQVEEDAGDPPRRRLPHHPRRPAPDVRARPRRQRHLHGLGPLQGGLGAQGPLRHRQARPDRAWPRWWPRRVPSTACAPT